MPKKTKKILLLITACVIFVQMFFCFQIIPAQAEEPKPIKPNTEYEIPGVDLTPVTVEAGKTMSIPWIKEYIIGIYKYLISIVGILVGVVIMIAGFMWASAGGNQTTIGNARAWIVSALSALIIAISGVAILNLLNPKLTEFGDITVKMPEKVTLKDWSSSWCSWLTMYKGDDCDSGYQKSTDVSECGVDQWADSLDQQDQERVCCCKIFASQEEKENAASIDERKRACLESDGVEMRSLGSSCSVAGLPNGYCDFRTLGYVCTCSEIDADCNDSKRCCQHEGKTINCLANKCKESLEQTGIEACEGKKEYEKCSKTALPGRNDGISDGFCKQLGNKLVCTRCLSDASYTNENQCCGNKTKDGICE